MNRAARRESIFRSHRDRAVFRGMLMDLSRSDGIVVHGWAIMPNHFHLLATAGPAGLGAALKRLQAGYARYLNAEHAWDGPVWRARFKSQPVNSEAYWRHLLAYVHANPVRAGFCQQVGALDWTSHRHYAWPHSAPEWLCTGEHLALFGTPAAYREYLRDWLGGVDVAPDGFDPSLLGAGTRRTRQVATEADAIARSPYVDRDAAWRAFEWVAGCSREAVVQHRASVDHQHVALWWLSRATGTPAAQVASDLGFTAGKAQYAARRVRAADREDLSRLRERLLALTLPSETAP